MMGRRDRRAMGMVTGVVGPGRLDRFDAVGRAELAKGGASGRDRRRAGERQDDHEAASTPDP